jgi:predicted SprT family Zn-dependent metalloprotease
MWLVRDKRYEGNPKVYDIKTEGDTYVCQACRKEFLLPSDIDWVVIQGVTPFCEKCRSEK